MKTFFRYIGTKIPYFLIFNWKIRLSSFQTFPHPNETQPLMLGSNIYQILLISILEVKESKKSMISSPSILF